jgi:hypothetical protein
MGAGRSAPARRVTANLALDHGLSSQGHQILRMGHFVFRCPATGFKVQHQLDDDPDVSENEYGAIICPACTRIHLVNRKTGKLLGQGDD